MTTDELVAIAKEAAPLQWEEQRERYQQRREAFIQQMCNLFMCIEADGYYDFGSPRPTFVFGPDGDQQVIWYRVAFVDKEGEAPIVLVYAHPIDEDAMEPVVTIDRNTTTEALVAFAVWMGQNKLFVPTGAQQ